MRSIFSKIALAAIFALAITFTFSCSGDDGDEGGGSGGSCGVELDGVWEAGGEKVTISGSIGTANGEQIYKGLTSTGNLTWSGQVHTTENGAVHWTDIQLTMSADRQKLTVISLDPDDVGEPLILTRKCNNQSGGGSSSPSGSSPSSGGNFNYGSMTDKGGKTYKTIKIGTQTWMAENLNYNASGSKCYGEGEIGDAVPKTDEHGNFILGEDGYLILDYIPTYSSAEIQANCTKYGRLYDWETANTACPSGWRLPNNEDWDILITAVGGEETAGKYLKAKSGWKDYEGNLANGEDKFGFSALPGGSGALGDNFVNFGGVGNGGDWWSASEYYDIYGNSLPYSWYMGDSERIYHNETFNSHLLSVRCVKDN